MPIAKRVTLFLQTSNQTDSDWTSNNLEDSGTGVLCENQT